MFAIYGFLRVLEGKAAVWFLAAFLAAGYFVGYMMDVRR